MEINSSIAEEVSRSDFPIEFTINTKSLDVAEEKAIKEEKFYKMAVAIKKAMMIAVIIDHDFLLVESKESTIGSTIEEQLILLIKIAYNKCKDESKIIPTLAEIINTSYANMNNWVKYYEIFIEEKKDE